MRKVIITIVVVAALVAGFVLGVGLRDGETVTFTDNTSVSFVY